MISVGTCWLFRYILKGFNIFVFFFFFFLFSRQNCCMPLIHSSNQALWAFLKIQFADMFFISHRHQMISAMIIFSFAFMAFSSQATQVLYLNLMESVIVSLVTRNSPRMITERKGRLYSLEVNSYYLALFLLLLQGGQREEIMYSCNVLKRKYLSISHC